MKWKTIPSMPLFECSPCGKVRRKETMVAFGSQKRKAGGKILSPKTKTNGYLELSLSDRSRYVHRLVAETWIAAIPPKFTINHIDGVKSNNNVNNLEIVSQGENSRHAYRTGLKKPTVLRGSKHAFAKTNEEEVLEVRKKHAEHHSIKKLELEFPHLTRQILTKVVYRQSWRHI